METYRHFKGGVYVVICEGVLEADPYNPDCIMTVYKDEAGKVWIRPSWEFHGYTIAQTPHGKQKVRRFSPLGTE